MNRFYSTFHNRTKNYRGNVFKDIGFLPFVKDGTFSLKNSKWTYKAKLLEEFFKT